MENLVNNAKQYLNTDTGRNMEQKFEQATGVNIDGYLGGSNQNQGNAGQTGNTNQQSQGGGQDPSMNQNQGQGSSTDAFGNQGQPGQYGQEGEYGAVRGKGLGGALQDQSAPQGQGMGQGQGQGQGQSAYEGMDQYDSTTSGGYGRNPQGLSFSRKNQMGADDTQAVNAGETESDDGMGTGGYKTGSSTPGYRQEGDVDAEAAENRIRNQNLNQYGIQSNDTLEKDGDHHEVQI